MAEVIKVLKKDGSIAEFDEQKIIDAVDKSAKRALTVMTPTDYAFLCQKVFERISELDCYNDDLDCDLITVSEIHSMVESILKEHFPKVGESYEQYRNYKLDFVTMLDEVYQKAQSIAYIGDVSNANSDSTLISTQRSLIYGALNKALYEKFFLNQEEIQAIRDGYIYIHDEKDRRDGVNCCLFDVKNVLSGGFEMGNVWYNEPNTLDVAFDVIGVVVQRMG